MNEQQFYACLLMVFFIALIFEGWRIIAYSIFLVGWQCLTPIRPVYIDVPLLSAILVIIELLFFAISLKIAMYKANVTIEILSNGLRIIYPVKNHKD